MLTNKPYIDYFLQHLNASDIVPNPKEIFVLARKYFFVNRDIFQGIKAFLKDLTPLKSGKRLNHIAMLLSLGLLQLSKFDLNHEFENEDVFSYLMIHEIAGENPKRKYLWGDGSSTSEGYKDITKKRSFPEFFSQRLERITQNEFIGTPTAPDQMDYIKYPLLAFSVQRLNYLKEKSLLPRKLNLPRLYILLHANLLRGFSAHNAESLRKIREGTREYFKQMEKFHTLFIDAKFRVESSPLPGTCDNCK